MIRPEDKNNREIVMEAVKKSGYALQFASENLKGDRDIVTEAVRKNRNALRYASKELKSDCVSAARLSETCDDMRNRFKLLAYPDGPGDFNLNNVTGGHALIVELASMLVLFQSTKEDDEAIEDGMRFHYPLRPLKQ